MPPEQQPASQKALSDRAYMQYLRTFGRNPKVVDFVQLYTELKDAFDSGSVPEDAFLRFKRSLIQMELEADAEASLLAINDQGGVIQTVLRRLGQQKKLPSMEWRRIINAYSDLLRTLVAEKELYWAPRFLAGRDGVRWVRLQNASPKQQVVEKVRRDDPVLFQRLQMSKEQRAGMDTQISNKIVGQGMMPARQKIRGRWMLVGVDPAQIPASVSVTDYKKRRVDGKTVFDEETYDLSASEVLSRLDDPSVVRSLPTEAVTVFDDDGRVQSREVFTRKVDRANKAHKGLEKINLSARARQGLRTLSDEELAETFGDNPQPDEYVALTDDPDKSTSLTKIYPVKDYRGKQIVTAGRFKGFYVSDLVNRAGRLIEGSVTYYNPETGELDQREVQNPDGSTNVRRVTEPYVTVDRGRMMLNIQGFGKGSNDYTLLRNSVRKLTKVVSSIQYIEGTGNGSFYFEPKDFAVIRDAIGAMALSNSASRMLRAYFAKLAKAERATDKRTITKYSGEKLGLRRNLRTQQAQAVAWLDANDNTGICALDTGVGKTAVAIATMQNLRRKGVAEEGNGRFLFVCKGALAGNLPKEIYKFIDREEADELVGMTDIITYFGFNKERKANDKYGDDYVAIFFDEAHERLKKKESTFYKSVSACKAKRKILMTASPMVRSPKEVFTLASVAQGIDLNTKEGRAAERKFTKRFAERVGGRVVGIKRADTSQAAYDAYVQRMTDRGEEPVPYAEWPGEIDPITSRDFNVWVKTNLFHASKRDVEDEEGKTLDELNVVPPIAVAMSEEVEVLYRKTMNDVLKKLRVVARDKYKGNKALAIEAAKVSLRAPLALLTRLSDVPNQVIPGAPNPKVEEAARIIEGNIGGRTILFTDSPALAEDSYSRMVTDFPGKGHAVAFSDKILATSATGKQIRYTPRRYPDPDRRQPKGAGYVMVHKGGKFKVMKNTNPKKRGHALSKKADWKIIVLSKFLQRDPTMSTVTLTGTYAVGQNLQSFTNVIHLDRDDWSNETMKQRSARAWRAGQSEIVNEYTLDTVYPDAVTNDDADKTLDEIRKIIQGLDESLFDEVILDSQVERLGEEWAQVKQQRSLIHKVDRQMLERALSPYAAHLGKQEGD